MRTDNSPCSKPTAGSMGSLNPGCTIKLWCSSGLELEAMLGPLSLGSLCSRLRRDVAYCCPLKLNPSGERGQAMDGNTVPSPGLPVNGCHDSGVWSAELKAKRCPGGSCDPGNMPRAGPWQGLPLSVGRNSVGWMNGTGFYVCFQGRDFVFLPNLIGLHIFFVFATGTLSLQTLLRARLKWASTMLLVSPWK